MTHRTPTQKGVIISTLMVIASIFSIYVLKNPFESLFQYFVYAVFCAGMVWSMLSYSKTSVDHKTFKDFFSTGFKTFIVITLVMAVFTLSYFSLNPEFRDQKIAENSRLLLLQGDHLPAEIDDYTKNLKKIFLPMMISYAVFRYLILGALITVITAGFLSGKNTTVA